MLCDKQAASKCNSSKLQLAATRQLRVKSAGASCPRATVEPAPAASEATLDRHGEFMPNARHFGRNGVRAKLKLFPAYHKQGVRDFIVAI
ncbi:hypothetical protein XH80_22705 [Bradyrhizobium sp. CCBAU 45384]|nr:hypothetical protein [Bradyrhizobium sp. CCBAU 45384]